MNILLDYFRGTRGIESSASIVAPLLSYGNRVSLRFFHTPQFKGISKQILTGKYREIIGLMHLKCYSFDDDIILTGANLSEIYFKQRQG